MPFLCCFIDEHDKQQLGAVAGRGWRTAMQIYYLRCTVGSLRTVIYVLCFMVQ